MFPMELMMEYSIQSDIIFIRGPSKNALNLQIYTFTNTKS